MAHGVECKSVISSIGLNRKMENRKDKVDFLAVGLCEDKTGSGLGQGSSPGFPRWQKASQESGRESYGPGSALQILQLQVEVWSRR